jgi:tetratricopeptide (TPR) repeat protein
VGAELGTAYVLDAQLRFLGERFRLNVRLLATETRRQVWAERYDCDRAETFDVQDELVRRIVGTLVGRIEDDRLECGRRKPPDQWEAYDLWLRGWSILRRSDIAAIGEARRLFRQALAKESRYASPYMGLALAHLNEWACFSWNHWVFPRQEVLDLAQKAVELDERDHRAHIVLGMTQIYGGDYDAARSQVTTALELNPNDADVLAHGSWALAILGRHDEAVEWGRRALRLAPHRPEWYSTFVGVALFAARRHEEAIETMATAPEALCNTPAFLAASYAHLERPDLGERYRETVYRHYRRHEARGEFPRGMSCVEWLVAMDPFCEPSDAEHYRSGLQSAGFE